MSDTVKDNSEDEEEYWPDRIIAQRRIEYSPLIIKEQMAHFNGEEPTFEDVLEMIRDYARDDLSCNWGHQIDGDDFDLFDPDGDEY